MNSSLNFVSPNLLIPNYADLRTGNGEFLRFLTDLIMQIMPKLKRNEIRINQYRKGTGVVA
jgi:hypothetical protein